jgi:hypothetical protein
VQDLSKTAAGRKAYLAPSSMNAGNTTADDQQLAMTAPGSTSVLPVPDRMDVLPMPKWTNDGQIPVSYPGNRQRVTADKGGDGSAKWDSMHDVPAESLWKETSG